MFFRYLDKYWFILLTTALFQVVGLNEVDKFGFDAFDEVNETIILRLMWFFAFCFLFFIGLMKYKVSKSFHFKGFAVVALFMLHYLLTSFPDIKALYFYTELTVLFMLGLWLIESDWLNDDALSKVNAAYLASTVLLLSTIFVIWLVDPGLVYSLETQGRHRLGGSVVSPNTLAVIMVVSLISLFYLRKIKTIKFPVFSFLTVVFICVIILTNSRTGIALLIVGIYVSSLYTLSNPSRFLVSAFLGFFVLVLFLYVIGFGQIGYGNDAESDVYTLNNRSYVFETALTGIASHPFLGVGYVVGVKDFFSNEFIQDFWKPPHSHNAFLETLLVFGLPLGVLLCFHLLKNTVLMCLSRSHYFFAGIQSLIILLYGLTGVPFSNKVGALFVFLVVINSAFINYRRKIISNREIVNV